MRNIIFILLYWVISSSVIAQTGSRNYIMSMRAREATTATLESQKNTHQDVQTDITYFDGLGRPDQQVQYRGSVSNGGTPDDLIIPYFYDNFGRQTQQGLPFVMPQSGNHVVGAMTELLGEYDATRAAGIPEINNPFAESQFEDSPLGRMMKTASPGEAWKMSGDNTVDYTYRSNTAADVIQEFNIDQSEFPFVSTYGTYPAGEL